MRGSPDVLRVIDGDAFRRLCGARDFVRAHHAEELPLERMARAAGMSQFHFARTFRRCFGQTPHGFLVQVRLARAKELLARRGSHVTDVCFEVGFASLGSFSTLFARQVGKPPSAWQRDMVRLAQVPGALASRRVPYCFAMAYAG
jgi:AraC-like DNA-binding protein